MEVVQENVKKKPMGDNHSFIIDELESLVATMEQDRADVYDNEQQTLNSSFLLSQQDLCRATNRTAQALSKYAASKGIVSKKIKSNSRGYSNSDVRHILESLGFVYGHEAKVLAFQMLKGGSGKTSAAVNLGVRLCHYGARVCFIDLDPQGNATGSFAIDTSDKATFIDVADGRIGISDALVSVSEGLDVLPCDFNNSGLDPLITTKQKNLISFVASHIETIRDDYDYIIIDCNPSLSHINTSITCASDEVIIPINPNKYSYDGLHQVLKELLRINKEFNVDVGFKLLYTMYKDRDNLTKKYLAKYARLAPSRLISTAIKENIEVKKTLDNNQFIFDNPKAIAKQDFDDIACELLGLYDHFHVNVH